MQQYIDLMKDVIDNGHSHPDRTKVGRRSVFGRQLRFNMADGFPLVTTRKIHTPALIHELVWFLMGTPKIDYLKEHGIKIWDKWVVDKEHIDKYFSESIKPSLMDQYQVMLDNADLEETPQEKILEERDNFILGVYNQVFAKYHNSVGPIYGPKWRNIPVKNMAFAPYEVMADPIVELITALKERPFSSRHVISVWDAASLANETISPKDNVVNGKGALAPCHVLQQYFVREEDGVKYLSLQMYQRSADIPVGVPYNIAQYSLLLHIIAHLTGMVPDEFVYTLGDAHIYFDQLELAKTQIQLEPLPLPKLKLVNDFATIDDFKFESYIIEDYNHHNVPLKYPVAE